MTPGSVLGAGVGGSGGMKDGGYAGAEYGPSEVPISVKMSVTVGIQHEDNHGGIGMFESRTSRSCFVTY